MTDSSELKPDSEPPISAPRKPVQIRIVHLLYSVAMLAASMATFGPTAILLGIAIVAFWAWVFLGTNRPDRLIKGLVLLFVFFILSGLLLPAVQSAREAA